MNHFVLISQNVGRILYLLGVNQADAYEIGKLTAEIIRALGAIYKSAA